MVVEAAVIQPEVRAVRGCERKSVVAWLDHGLRRGEEGRLEAEYPASLTPALTANQRAVFAGVEPASHAMFHEVEVRVGSASLTVGLIGLVYTEPTFRGLGLARACIDSCLAELQRRRVPLAMLWSDRHDFYARLGFQPAGRETFYGVDAAVCRRALGGEPPLDVDSARPGDFPQLEALYDEKRVRVLRPPGALARLASAPETRLVVARRGDRPEAYAAMGRGDDFAGVAHEWAGTREGVLSCLAALCAGRREVVWLAGPEAEALEAALVEAGAVAHSGCLGLASILHAGALFDRVAPESAARLHVTQEGDRVRLRGRRGSTVLAQSEALQLLFGHPESPDLSEALDPEEAARLTRELPWPLYLWGFDSI